VVVEWVVCLEIYKVEEWAEKMVRSEVAWKALTLAYEWVAN